ncbi:unnamed protein product [Adineta ricciae]|uniref:CRAL-TRIO domain-containing protein n=1 Tax=Adineta ricciae TaxID=249248 RepID=A0A815XN08_ADIRI|nr:unnamed protein product [Adineta ricciae]CAF1559596.1 unnamed protein product [Adineta ricciae]
MSTSSPLFDINELTDEQQKKFEIVYKELQTNYASYIEFKVSLQLKNPMEQEEEENEWQYQLYRFLRARKWNVEHTIKSILEMLKWRMDNRVDAILEQEKIAERMATLRKIVPNANHGYTKADRPLYIEKSGIISVDKILSSFQHDELIECHLYWLELYSQLARERSRQVGKHVESFAIIYDLHGCKLDMRKMLPLLNQSLFIDDNYYPERLGQLFVINPPLIFPTLWSIVKHWVDPVTKTKILILKKGVETTTTLLQYIDADQLPKEYGGSCQSCSTTSECIPVEEK